mmetsp:Transcript_15302/g.35835  ORF Transcript_15302/g.35835 Transcript_15302/m.35835 type:complete len:212 (-) Transcript_15302:398-1033(-)
MVDRRWAPAVVEGERRVGIHFKQRGLGRAVARKLSQHHIETKNLKAVSQFAVRGEGAPGAMQRGTQSQGRVRGKALELAPKSVLRVLPKSGQFFQHRGQQLLRGQAALGDEVSGRFVHRVVGEVHRARREVTAGRGRVRHSGEANKALFAKEGIGVGHVIGRDEKKVETKVELKAPKEKWREIFLCNVSAIQRGSHGLWLDPRLGGKLAQF